MMWAFIDSISFGIDTVIYAFFYTRCLRVRHNHSKRAFPISCFFFFALKILLTRLNTGYNEYISILLSLGFCYFLYEGSLQVYTVWAAIAVVTNGIINFLILSIAVALPGIPYELFEQPGFVKTICIVASKCLLLTCYFVMTIHNQRSIKVRWSNTLLLLCLSIGCWALLEIFFHYTDALQGSLAYWSLPIIGSAGMLVVMVSSTVLYNQLMRQEKEYADMQIRLRATQMTSIHIIPPPNKRCTFYCA